MKKLTVWIFLIVSNLNLLIAQDKISIEAFVYCEETKRPLEYVNIGILGKPIGTLTTKNGSFKMVLDKNLRNDTLHISCIGYESKNILVRDAQLKEAFFLKASVIELKEVVISSKKIKEVKEGSFSESTKIVTGWSNGSGNGGERGILIKNKKNRRKINSISFHVAQTTCDSLLVRIRIRKVKDMIPQEDVLKQSVTTLVKTQKGWVNVDLSDYNLYFDENILVSLEWLRSYGGNYCNFLISSSYLKGTLYAKESSATDWRRKKGFSPSIYINTSKVN